MARIWKQNLCFCLFFIYFYMQDGMWSNIIILLILLSLKVKESLHFKFIFAVEFLNLKRDIVLKDQSIVLAKMLLQPHFLANTLTLKSHQF